MLCPRSAPAPANVPEEEREGLFVAFQTPYPENFACAKFRMDSRGDFFLSPLLASGKQAGVAFGKTQTHNTATIITYIESHPYALTAGQKINCANMPLLLLLQLEL